MYLSDIIEAVEQFGPIFVQVYGQGECPMGITVLPRYQVCRSENLKKWKTTVAVCWLTLSLRLK